MLFPNSMITVWCVSDVHNHQHIRVQGEDASELKLDFTFDAELAKLTEEKTENKDVGEPPKPIQMPPQAATSTPPHMVSATSPATEDLGFKIASVKNVWDCMSPMATVFEQMDHRYCAMSYTGNQWDKVEGYLDNVINNGQNGNANLHVYMLLSIDSLL